MMVPVVGFPQLSPAAIVSDEREHTMCPLFGGFTVAL